MTDRIIFIAVVLGIAGLVILALWDVALVWQGHATVSDRIRVVAKNYPMFPFVVGLIGGLLAGHWFWDK